ncbi:hypothetical protein ABBQ38_001404 [Trebouxia sp. C0009 RCD-2024]
MERKGKIISGFMQHTVGGVPLGTLVTITSRKSATLISSAAELNLAELVRSSMNSTVKPLSATNLETRNRSDSPVQGSDDI